jgi:glycosyltransferase involved in cell wall biosynthesis
MEERCADRGIAGRFRFTGWVDYDRVPDHVRLADVVVVTSASEGQALVYLEAQARGRTLIAGDIAAAREVVVHGRTGLLYRIGDVDELTAKALLAARDRSLRNSLGREARERGQALFAPPCSSCLRRAARQCRPTARRWIGACPHGAAVS